MTRYGIGLIILMAAFVALTVGAYLKVFTPAERVTLLVPTAGLQLGPRADVKLFGVLVGEVESLRATTRGAEITLALQPETVAGIDRGSTARLLPKTLFGEKFVDLVPPERPTAPISDGDVIRQDTSAATVETAQVLDRLLRTVRPERLNATLNALATTLEGRGERIGRTLERADDYLADLEPHLPAIRRDLAKLADVTDLYGDAAPGLLRTLANSADLSRTITAKKDAIDRATALVPRAADSTERLLRDNEPGIVGLQHVARPALGVAARYSPSIACVFQGLERLRPLLAETFGHGRIKATIEIVKAEPPYRPGADAPAYDDRRGPDCYGLPDHPPIPFPEIGFRDGTDDLARLMIR